jgi:hypothetical protein
MTDERLYNVRRSEDIIAFDKMQEKIDQMHSRVYNGLGKELREEVKKETTRLSNRLWAVIMVIVIALAGIVIQGRMSSNQASMENDRNYKAIIDLGERVTEHIYMTEPKK